MPVSTNSARTRDRAVPAPNSFSACRQTRYAARGQAEVRSSQLEGLATYLRILAVKAQRQVVAQRIAALKDHLREVQDLFDQGVVARNDLLATEVRLRLVQDQGGEVDNAEVVAAQELNRLMGDARKRQFDAIVVWRFDRFARSTKHLLLALEEFRSLGIQFISYQENIDTASPLGQALFTIISAVAQLERDLIRERVTAGIRNARAHGKQLGRPQRILDGEQMLRMRAEGASLRQIAAALGIGYGTIRMRLQTVSGKPQ